MRAVGNSVELVEIPNGDHNSVVADAVVAEAALRLRAGLN
jgi:hypothetical protein